MDILSTGYGSQYLVVFYVFPDRFKLGLNCPAPVPPSGCSRGTASWNMDARYSGFRLPSYPAIQQLGLTCTANSLCVMIVFAVCECWKIMNNAQMILLSLLWPLPPSFTENFKRGVYLLLTMVIIIICHLWLEIEVCKNYLFHAINADSCRPFIFLSQDCHC